MDLEVGMYVRTKKGLIARYIDIDYEYGWHVFDDRIQWFYEYYREEIDFSDWKEFINKNVKKASHNIIDLIQVGDYVNGYKVCEIIEKGQKSYNGEIVKEKCFCLDNNYNFKFYNDEIENVVTKEQFEMMSYKVCD